ncbi:MAG: DUF1786 family protein [Promethearchaeota archaeon]
MKIIALDIGFGTEDILIYDSKKRSMESMNKMVVDSPSMRYARIIRNSIGHHDTIFIYGKTIGGGAIVAAIKDAIANHMTVIMTETAAKTIRNNLEIARKLGVKVIPDTESDDYSNRRNLLELELKEINRLELMKFFNIFNINIDDLSAIAVAVQDHGVPDINVSQRKFRFEHFRQILSKGGRAVDFTMRLDEIPKNFERMTAIRETLKEEFPNIDGIIMDTSPATLFGLACDSTLNLPDEFLGVNVGNGHTLAGIFRVDRLIAIFEMHTGHLNNIDITTVLSRFTEGKLTFKEIYEAGGHGTYYQEMPYTKINECHVIGPNRFLLQDVGINLRFPAPMGDVMMSGPLTLVTAAKEKLGLE